MTSERLAVEDLRLLGGWLCLDFVNSIENRAGHGPEDFLTSYPDLVRWGAHAGLVADAAAADPRAGEALHQALELRAAFHRLFLAIATKQRPDPADLERLRGAYADAMSGATLVPANERFAWAWRPDEQRLDHLLWPVARSAVAVRTTGESAA